MREIIESKLLEVNNRLKLQKKFLEESGNHVVAEARIECLSSERRLLIGLLGKIPKEKTCYHCEKFFDSREKTIDCSMCKDKNKEYCDSECPTLGFCSKEKRFVLSNDECVIKKRGTE